MPFNQTEYISNFNKNNYKMYQFRVKKSDINIINHLDNIENRNGYIVSLINTDIKKSIYTIKEIKNIIKPILSKYGITEIYLFGSYARGEAKESSDIDIAIITDDFKNDIIDEELNLMRLRRKIDTRIEPHLIRIEDYKNAETPFIQEVIDTGIKVA